MAGAKREMESLGRIMAVIVKLCPRKMNLQGPYKVDQKKENNEAQSPKKQHQPKVHKDFFMEWERRLETADINAQEQGDHKKSADRRQTDDLKRPG